MSMNQKQLYSADRRTTRQGFYNTSHWRRIRSIQLRKRPLCEWCEKQRRLTVATDCDHVDPSWESWLEFLAGPFQSLCGPCHRDKTELEDMPKLRKAEKLKLEVWE